MKALLLLPLLLAASATQEEWSDEASALLDRGDIDAAILVLEARLEGAPDDARAWRLMGRALEALWRDGGESFLVVTDAASAWDRAVELEPFDVMTLFGAAEVRMVLGDYRTAAELGLRALGTARVLGGEAPAGLVGLVVRARMGVFQALATEDDQAWRAELASVWAATRGARTLLPADTELMHVEASFLDALGLPDLALARLTESLRAAPGDSSLHRLLIDLLGTHELVERLPSIYSRFGAEGMNGTLAWYTGYVHRLVADQALRERRFADALPDYGTSIEWMSAAKVLEPSFSGGADSILIQARVSAAWCRLGQKDLDGAERALRAILEDSPELVDARDGLGRSAMDGVSSLAETLSERNLFGRAAELSRAVARVRPEDGLWWNNVGFFLREHGTQIENGAFPEIADPKAAAEAVYRDSWQAYRRAAELSPEDARIVNDAALLQVYHVQDDLALAEEMLLRAVRVGEAQLAELGESPPETERFPLAQAVGDAYQNLGYLYYHLLGRPQESRRFWVASMATDSGDRSGFQEYLDAIDGKREPLGLRDGGFVQAPETEEPERVAFGWERSLEEARALADSEGRPLFVYARGAGLGLSVPFYDRMATSSAFGERLGNAVLVVADALRHNFVDRTTAGRRLPCPKWGSIACADHVAAAAEFADWFRAREGREPGEATEGFWARTADEDALHMLVLEGLFSRVEPAQIFAAGVETRFDPAALAPTELVLERRRAARDRVEELLFRPGMRERPALVDALVADEHPSSRDLLAAAGRQLHDAELLLLVLERDPEVALDSVQRAAWWSTDLRVRETAEAILARRLEGHERLTAARSMVASDSPRWAPTGR